MKLILIFLVGLGISPTSLLASTLTPTVLASVIQTKDAKFAVNTLEKTNQWDAVTTFMAQGQPAWIALAPRLAAGSDAGASEDLGIALAFALPKAPRAVLGVIDPTNGPVIGVDRVCGVPFIEGTIDNIDSYVKASQLAVAGVNDPALSAVKASCLQALK